jgi:RimJ/RimL family protein N-acetyltransferase
MTLEPCTTLHVRKLIEGAEAFERWSGWKVSEGYLEFPEALGVTLHLLEKFADSTDRAWWEPYLFVHEADRTLMGLGGYKGPPDNGVVEIGYGIAPAYRRKGHAFEAAQALITHAFGSADIHTVRAHTLPEVNASNRVLMKCGMSKVAVINDPGDGVLWRWEIRKMN